MSAVAAVQSRNVCFMEEPVASAVRSPGGRTVHSQQSTQPEYYHVITDGPQRISFSFADCPDFSALDSRTDRLSLLVRVPSRCRRLTFPVCRLGVSRERHHGCRRVWPISPAGHAGLTVGRRSSDDVGDRLAYLDYQQHRDDGLADRHPWSTLNGREIFFLYKRHSFT